MDELALSGVVNQALRAFHDVAVRLVKLASKLQPPLDEAPVDGKLPKRRGRSKRRARRGETRRTKVTPRAV
jgi:hypothetical protein